MTEFTKSEKQMEVMELIFAAADRGEFLTIRELKARLSYGPGVSYPAIVCTVKILRNEHGLIESVYGEDHGEYRQGTISYLKPTVKAYRTLRPS